MTYVCACCGETHDDLPDLAFDRPLYAWQVPQTERAARVSLTKDLCVIDGQDHFIRGVIEIPVHGQEQAFGIGVWVSQKPENFREYADNPDSARIGPFFGWLSNELNYRGASTLNLKTMAHFRGGDRRPRFELEPTSHPLAVAQREGVSLDAAWTFVHAHTNDAGR